MPLVDSVFSPPLRFADDLLLPIADIEASQRQVEDSATGAMVAAIEVETQGLLERADRALADGDVAALLALQWPVAGMLARAIVSLWGAGFAAGAEDGLEEMRRAVSPVVPMAKVRRFALADDMAAVLNLEPQQLINTGAVEAVLGRANLLAGNFSDDVFNDLRQDLIAAIVPQAGTGNPISRAELLGRIQKTLGVAENRASLISQTETTYAYNTGRVSSFEQSSLVDYYRVIPVIDGRTSEICRSRAGLVVPKDQINTIGGLPPWHGRCRTTIGAVMSQLSRFQEMVNDPDRDPVNRTLAPLPKGWRTTGAAATSASRWPTGLPANHVISDDARITRSVLDGALDSIAARSADAAERVGKFRQFAEQQRMQAVFRDQSMTPRQAAASRWKIIDQLDEANSIVVQAANRNREWLKNNKGDRLYEQRRRATNDYVKKLVDNIDGAGGYTYMDSGRHIVVKVDASKTVNWDYPMGDRAAAWTEQVMSRAETATSFDQLLPVTGANYPTGDPTKVMGVYFHESGHQVHAAAGKLQPPDAMMIITRYAEQDDFELVAESFAAYMMDGDRFRQADPTGYDWITQLLDTALENTRP